MAEPQAPEAQVTPGRDVFISYASQDVSVASAIVEALEKHGIKCWIAPRDVKAGAQYADAIIRALSGAKAIVLVLSANAIASSHVGKEIERASSKKRPIIALRTDAAPLTPALEYFLSESQWIEIHAGAMQTAYAKLIDAIRDPAHPAPEFISAAVPETLAATPSVAQPKSHRNWTLLAAGFAVAVLALAALWAPKYWFTKHSPTEQAPTVATIPNKSIAVLPFTDMSEKRDQEYFADGMAEEILNLLGKIPDLTVIGRTSSFRFNEKSDDLLAIGKALGAVYVVEGSVRRFNDRVRVTAQLIDTRNGAHRWSETYDRGVTDVLTVQSEIGLSVVRALQLEVAPGISIEPRPTLVSSAAYDAYLRGLHLLDRMDQPDLEEAVADFQHARELDPAFAPAAEGLARAREAQAYWGFVPSRTGFEQAREAAELALTLNPKSAFAHGALCDVYTEFYWNWSAAEREAKSIVELAPGNPSVLGYAADERMAVGQLSESLQLVDTAIASDPFNAELYIQRSWVYLRLGRLAEAEGDSRRVLNIRPSFAWGHYYLAIVLLAAGKPEPALAELQQEVGGIQQAGLAVVYQALHRTKDADAALARLKADDGGDLAMEIAEAYAYGGQRDEAFAWLEKAFAQRDFNLYYIKGDPLLKKLVSDARYKAFLHKMNLPE